MSRSILTKFLLIILLGVPVVWYLFLQSFGKNEFELNVLGKAPVHCYENSPIIQLRDFESLSVTEQNQLERLKDNLKDTPVGWVVLSDSSDCLASMELDLMLVDADGGIRGHYGMSLEEIDRAIVESDLLLYLTSNE